MFLLGDRWWIGFVSNTLVFINKVTQHRVQLVLGCDCLWAGKPPQYVSKHPGQLSLATPFGE